MISNDTIYRCPYCNQVNDVIWAHDKVTQIQKLIERKPD